MEYKKPVTVSLWVMNYELMPEKLRPHLRWVASPVKKGRLALEISGQSFEVQGFDHEYTNMLEFSTWLASVISHPSAEVVRNLSAYPMGKALVVLSRRLAGAG